LNCGRCQARSWWRRSAGLPASSRPSTLPGCGSTAASSSSPRRQGRRRRAPHPRVPRARPSVTVGGTPPARRRPRSAQPRPRPSTSTSAVPAPATVGDGRAESFEGTLPLAASIATPSEPPSGTRRSPLVSAARQAPAGGGRDCTTAATVPAGIVPAVADDVLYEVDARVGRITINRSRSSQRPSIRRCWRVLRQPSPQPARRAGAGWWSSRARRDPGIFGRRGLIGPDSPAAGPSANPRRPPQSTRDSVNGAPASPAAEPPGASTGPSPSELHEARAASWRRSSGICPGSVSPRCARRAGIRPRRRHGLALACDLVVAAADAVFGTPEIDIGIWRTW